MNIPLLQELERCREWIESALEYSGGTHDFGDIIKSVSCGEMQLWCGERAAIVTEIVCYPKKKILHIFLAGGELEQVLDMEDSIVHWAKEQGCTAVTLAGRKGWERVLARMGLKFQHSVLMAEI